MNDNIETETAENTPEKNQADNLKLIKNLRFQRKVNIHMVRIFFILWISASLIAFIPGIRPSFSVTEKRELHKFPEFSFSALFSGDYFDNIGLWYSDTFPFRDGFVNLGSKIQSTFGIKSIEIYDNTEEPAKENESDTKTDTASQKPEAQPDKTDNASSAKVNSGSDEKNNSSSGKTEPPKSNVTIEKIGTMAIIDNAGYEYYNFSKKRADAYVSAVSRAADKLKGKARVFNTVIPTSTAVTLDDGTAARLSSSNQETAINYIYKNMSKNTVCVDSYGILREHRDEYIYFRTDHHWTADGAYYSYCRLAEAAGKTPASLSAFKKYTFKGFLGSFYTASKMSARLGKTPDTIYAYEPEGIERIKTYEKDFQKDYHIVSNADKLEPSEKYLTFICGDHPLGVITNDKIKDDSACLIVKESFGNAMVAYFSQNYNKVYVADYRKIKYVYSGKIKDFAAKYKIDDVYFVNNISATRNEPLIKMLSDFIG